MAFYRLEPWGSQADDERLGNIAATIWNVNLGRGGKPRSGRDYWIGERPAKVPQTVEEQKALARQIGAMFGVRR